VFDLRGASRAKAAAPVQAGRWVSAAAAAAPAADLGGLPRHARDMGADPESVVLFDG
jgi:hypothetical protein